MRRFVAALLAASLTLALVPGVATARQRDAKSPPTVSGPLVTFGEPQCQSDVLEDPLFGRIAKSEVCLWAYDLVPAELDVDENFSALWIQYEVKGIGDWCVTEVLTYFAKPSDGRIVSSASPRKGRFGTAKRQEIELLVDGEKSAPLPGAISQETTVPAGRVASKTTEESFSFHWTGSSSAKIVMAFGLQTTHRALPPSLAYEQGLGLRAGVAQC